MRRSLVLVSLLLIAAFTATGCRESQNTITAENINIDLQASELVDGTQVLIVEVLDDDGEEIPVESLAVRGDMNHAGMVPVIVELDTPEALQPFKSTEPGVYLVPFGWTMGGEWILTVDVTFPDTGSVEGLEASTQFTLDVTENMVVDEMDMGGMDHSGMDMESTPESTPENTPEAETGSDS